jgi:hypothetical protein
VIGEKELVDFTVQESPFDRFSKKLGASVAEQIGDVDGFSRAFVALSARCMKKTGLDGRFFCGSGNLHAFNQ